MSTRVALVKPGDVLLIGNIGSLDFDNSGDLHAAVVALKDALGLSEVFMFEGDIDLGLTTATAEKIAL